MTNKIIAISGKMGSGKTSLSNELLGTLLNSVNYKFAEVIYEMHNNIKDIARGYGIDFPEKHRKLLQYLGTDLFRQDFGDNVWCDVMTNRIDKLFKNNSNAVVVIDDMRFESEFDCIRSKYPDNSLLVRLECPEEIRQERVGSAWNPTPHQSELDLDNYCEENKFDVLMRTNVFSSKEIVSYIMDGFIYDGCSLKLF